MKSHAGSVFRRSAVFDLNEAKRQNMDLIQQMVPGKQAAEEVVFYYSQIHFASEYGSNLRDKSRGFPNSHVFIIIIRFSS